MARRADAVAAALLACLLGGTAAAQTAPPGPVLRVAFAAAPARHQTPALAWLCEHHLPARAEWPRGLDPRGAFALQLDAAGLRIHATKVTVAEAQVAVGSCTIGPHVVLMQCATDGTEDWHVPAGLVLPAPWRTVLNELDAMQPGVPRTLAAAVLAGHLAGGLADGDPRADLLRIGSSACGDVTWLGWRSDAGVRVRGRSEGGLTLPALLVSLAVASERGSTGLQLRAFAARDVDRAEAARRLLRSEEHLALPTLRSLLHADDPTRLAAIDTLVRRHCTTELPAIVAAGDADNPWAALAAVDALRELWLDADPIVQQRTRAALARSDSMLLRSIDTTTLPRRLTTPPAAVEAADGAPQARALILLGLMAIGIAGLWQRERLRLATADSLA